MTTADLPGGSPADLPEMASPEEVGEYAEEEPRLRVRVWDRVVRTTHWLIALSLGVLAVTGIYIGKPYIVVPGPAGEHFVMGTMKVIHFYAAIVFSLAVLSRILWMFVGTRRARWWNLIPTTKARWKDLSGTFRFYTFLKVDPPPAVGHNALAGFAYAFVFLLYLVMIFTGLAMYSVNADVSSVMRSFSFLVPVFGGLQMARWIHHVVMWLLIGFFVHHIYSAVYMAIVDKTGVVDSMFSGNKWIPRSLIDKDREAQKRFEERGSHE